MNTERHNKYSGSSISRSNKVIDINLDMRTLDIMCRALVTDTQIIRRGQLINLRNLIYLLNPSIYENDIEKREKIIFIKKGIEARLDYNLTSPHMILSHINGSIIDTVNLSDYQDLSSAEINWMNKIGRAHV